MGTLADLESSEPLPVVKDFDPLEGKRHAEDLLDRARAEEA